jgi:hypothetical protein
MKLTIKNLLLTATLLLTLSAALAQPAAASLQDTLALAVENSASVGNARNARRPIPSPWQWKLSRLNTPSATAAAR